MSDTIKNCVTMGEIDEIQLSELRAEHLIVTEIFWKHLRGRNSGETTGSFFATIFDRILPMHFMPSAFDNSCPNVHPQKLHIMDGLSLDDGCPDSFGGWHKFDNFLRTKRLVIRVSEGVMPEYLQMVLEKGIPNINWADVLPENFRNSFPQVAICKSSEAFPAVENCLLDCISQPLINMADQKRELLEWYKEKNKKSREIRAITKTPVFWVDCLEKRCQNRQSWNNLLEALRQQEIRPDILTPDWVNKNLFSDNIPLPGSFWFDVPKNFLNLCNTLIPLFYKDDAERREYFRKVICENEESRFYGEKYTTNMVQESIERSLEEVMHWDALEKYDALNTAIDDHCRAFMEGNSFGLSLEGTSHVQAYIVARIKRALPPKKKIFDVAKCEVAQAQVSKARAEEKERIMGVLAHNLNGMLASSVVRPMTKLKRDGVNVKEVLEGVELLRELIDAVKLSKSGTYADFLSDLRSPGDGAVTVGEIVQRALYATVANMLSEKYSGDSGYAFFPETEQLKVAEREFDKLDRADRTVLIKFIKEHLVGNIEIDLGEVGGIPVGNALHTASRMTSLFQELLQNAFKNVAFVSSSERRFSFTLRESVNRFAEVEVCNTFNKEEGKQSDTRLGNDIIDGFIIHFGSLPRRVYKDNGEYKTSFLVNLRCV